MKAGVVASVFLALVLVWPGPVRAASPDAQLAQDVSDIIWCYDEDRDLVTRKPAWKCASRVIDEAQAQEIRLQRIRRIQGLIKKPAPFFPGQRLSGTGSGFFITETGSVLTNWHVVDSCKGISFTPASGKPLVAQLVASEKLRDLALLQTSFTPAGVAPFRSSRQPDRSEDVFIVGYPLHGKVAIKPILVAGHVVDAESHQRPGRFPMQIDVRRGNSGGPVLDRAGRVVGVVVAKVNTLNVYAQTGRLIRNVGIAIRLPVALDFLKQHDVTVRERSSAPRLSITEIYSQAHQFVGQVGCWR